MSSVSKVYTKMTTKQLIAYVRAFNFTRLINQLHAHHTYLPNKAMFTGSNYDAIQWGMEDYHIKTNGWSAIAQHLTLFPDGMWLLGRDLNQVPASILGWNTGSICIEMIGNFDTNQEKLLNPQADAMYEFCEFMVEQKNLTLKFHRDSPTAYKTCPGNGIDRDTFFHNVANFTENKLAMEKAVRDEAARVEAQKRVEELKRIMAQTRILFKDMMNQDGKVHWANDTVNALADKKIVKGYPNKDGGFDFHPDAPITRAECATLLMKTYESIMEEIKKVELLVKK